MVNCYWFLIGTTTLNYALKKKKKKAKNQQKKIVHETVNLCLPNLTKPKKKSKNTTNCHNTFIFNCGKFRFDILLFIL